MGLDRDFLAMLTAPFSLERSTGSDTWGNEQYQPAEQHMGYVDGETTSYGTADEGGEQEAKIVTSAQILCDAIDVDVDDMITYGTSVRWVSGVETIHDEKGSPLYQTVTVTNQKKG